MLYCNKLVIIGLVTIVYIKVGYFTEFNKYLITLCIENPLKNPLRKLVKLIGEGKVKRKNMCKNNRL